MAANTELLERVLRYIELHPEEWDQDNWRCGTSFCFAGHTALLSGWKPTQTEPSEIGWRSLDYESLEAAVAATMSKFSWLAPEERQERQEARLRGLVEPVLNYSDSVRKDGRQTSICIAAEEELGLSEADAGLLFSSTNSLDDLRQMVAYIKENGSLDGF